MVGAYHSLLTGYQAAICNSKIAVVLLRYIGLYLLINLKYTFFDTAVGSGKKNWHASADRDETGSHLDKFDPPHPILIETHSYRRPEAACCRPSESLCGHNGYASLRFLGSATLSTSTHRRYDESVHRIKQLTRGNNTIPYHRL